MTVAQLIDQLLTFDDDLEVRYDDQEFGGYRALTGCSLRPHDLPNRALGADTALQADPFVALE